MNSMQRIIVLGAIGIGFFLGEIHGGVSVKYDLFRTPASRVARACNSLNSYMSATSNSALKKISPSISTITNDESFQSVIHAYELANIGEMADAVMRDPGIEAAFLTVILEKCVNFYYAQLDVLESAYTYWSWAQKHTSLYAVSKSPMQWFSGMPNQLEIEYNYIKTKQLRDLCNAEFGTVVRFLNLRNSIETDLVTWISEVQSFLNLICAEYIVDQTSHTLPDTLSFTQKLISHEKRIIRNVNEIKMPHWFRRHWLALTVGTVATGMLTYSYMNNQGFINDLVKNGLQLTIDKFNKSCYEPIQGFVNEVVGGETKLTYYVQATFSENGDVVGYADTPKTLKLTASEADKISQTLRTLGIKNGITGRECLYTLKTGSSSVTSPSAKDYNWPVSGFIAWLDGKSDILGEGLTGTATGAWEYIAGLDVVLQRVLNELNIFIEETRFNRKLMTLFPAYLLVSSTYKGFCGIFNWLRKKDRRQLLLRFSQMEELLIRTKDEQLMDDEYGRLLYLLMKEHEQVAKNVLPDEQDAFLENLQYLVQTQPSVAQRKETLQAMLRKYRSLAPL